MICMKKELVASLSDVSAMVVECPCGARVKVPVSANLTPRDKELKPLEKCPVCLGPFDSTVLAHVKAFIQVLGTHHGSEKISLLLNTEDLET
jgi:hypothetical protein